ncbi:MAG: NAD(+) synthase [Planctomycetaceae bacterium]|nr:NAD(+) synthase [Planctomycetaceae bacterium]
MTRYSVATLNQIPLDWSGNRRRILEAVREAQNHGASLLVLPELALSGAGCQNHFRRPDVLKQALDSLEKIVPETKGLTVNIGFPFGVDGERFNAAAWISDGEIALIHCKTRPEKQYFDEERWFDFWEPNRISLCNLFGQDTFYGDYSLFHFPTGDGGEIFVQQQIGEPDWDEFPHSYENAHLRIVASASPFAFGKHDRRENAIRSFSEQNRCVCLYANLLGCEGTPYIYDGAAIIADRGEIVAESQRFSYRETPGIADILPAMKQRPQVCRQDACDPREEFDCAIPLALFDYLRKSRSHGFVLSLSGGADSAAVAVLVASMVRYAWTELTPQEFFRRLDFIPGLADCQNPEEATAKLLTCVYQRTQNSSDTTRNAAKSLAESLGAAFHEIKIGQIVGEYTKLITPIYGKPPCWEENDTALQNIQARVRGPSVWFLANLKNALLLNAGNRSEATVGYTTMDGDTCGALAPVGGIDKAFLRDWLRWKETSGKSPVPALCAINEQEPTAELRPPQCAQTDENDLMPYPILNRLEQLIVRDKRSPEDAVKRLLEESPELSENDVQLWTERFCRLWTRNQWKRKRYAMSFHVDDEAVADGDHYPNLCAIER